VSVLLGCIADDFTGATDLAGMLVRHGMRTVQMVGVPGNPKPPAQTDAIVVALKSRTTPAHQAVAQSLPALAWLKKAGCKQFFFKYCSTFDSTDAGNIGPVIDALLAALDSKFTIACPAFPENKRTVFKGHLFVGDTPLHESGMQNHPLTPMTDPNLVRVLSRQTRRKVGLVPFDDVSLGPQGISAAIDRLRSTETEIAIVDAVRDADLLAIGTACADLPLITGGSGIAMGLPQNFRQSGLLAPNPQAGRLPRITGPGVVIAGSCSQATLEQIERMKRERPWFRVDPLALASDIPVVEDALNWAAPLLRDGPLLIYASATPSEVQATQTQLGSTRAGELVEQALAGIAQGLVGLGVRRFIVAGGETSGAVVNRLGIKGLHIGQQIDPGVPWTVSVGAPSLTLALKSGNFGTPDFFLKAWGERA
jgi:uncharacterized protein YgbK (DUF1537 family)